LKKNVRRARRSMAVARAHLPRSTTTRGAGG
jgi:hypothetical protein